MTSDFVPTRPPRLTDGGADFVPAPYARADGGFTSLLERLAGSGGVDFVPDLSDQLDEPQERSPEPERIREEAFAAGRAAAEAEAAEQIAALEAELAGLRAEREAAGALAEGVERFRVEALRQAASDLATLALAMAGRVVGESLALDHEVLLGVINRSLERLPGEDLVSVRVRPEDLSLLEGRLRPRRAIRLVADPDLEGGCILEADFGRVDASLEAAMDGLSEVVDRWRMEHQL